MISDVGEERLELIITDVGDERQGSMITDIEEERQGVSTRMWDQNGRGL